MTCEITLRFEDARADICAFWEDLVAHFDPNAVAKGSVVCGLYFVTDRKPQDFLDWMFMNNFEMSEFTFELKAAKKA